MPLVKKILNKLDGLRYPQEYLCFAKESFHSPLHAYLVTGTRIVKDITNQHLFTGYCPLVFAFADPTLPASLQIIFSKQPLHPNEAFSAKDALASLDLQLVKKQTDGSCNILYYEGTRGSHHFLSRFQQFIGSVKNEWYNKKPGNVFLHSNLYKQVQIAYSLPRVISLITIGSNNLFNLFPTDLHGQIDEQHYIISLRTGGKACQQVETTRRLVISGMHSDAYKMAYSLGKNHMQELKPGEAFPFSELLSENLKWPLPEYALACRELTVLGSFNHGIHTIFLFKIDARQQLRAENSTLAHIHSSYASWRCKNGLTGNYLLR